MQTYLQNLSSRIILEVQDCTAITSFSNDLFELQIWVRIDSRDDENELLTLQLPSQLSPVKGIVLISSVDGIKLIRSFSRVQSLRGPRRWIRSIRSLAYSLARTYQPPFLRR
jgi:hypothetical protein